jgi:hypothetical protein
MFSAIKVILAAFDKGTLNEKGVSIALQDYINWGGDGQWSVFLGAMANTGK